MTQNQQGIPKQNLYFLTQKQQGILKQNPYFLTQNEQHVLKRNAYFSLFIQISSTLKGQVQGWG